MKRLLYFLLALPVFVTGCSLDANDRPADASSSGGAMTFVLAMPDPNAGLVSYALSEPDENALGTLDVFAFQENESGKYILREHAEVDSSAIKPGAENRYKSFRVNFIRLKEKEDYVFVVIANGRDLVSGNYAIGDERDVIMPKLELELEKDKRWIDAKRNIPMWGETGIVTLENNNETKPEVRLLRMLAKIEVKVDKAVQSKFKLNSVRLYNYRTGGRVVPDRDKLVTTLDTANATTVYGDRVVDKVQLFDGRTGLKPTKCLRQIYTFETDVPKDGAKVKLDEVHCVVIGGSYNGGDETFYRVNFIRKDTLDDNTIHTTFLPLLRNHSYEVIVKEVNGDGYADEGEAFDGNAFNMVTDVRTWDDAEMKQFSYDGQHILSLSQKEWEFSKHERTGNSTDNILHVYTDYPGGWSYDISLGSGKPGWLKLNDEEVALTGNPTGSVHLILATNDQASYRTGTITFKAGRLSLSLNVTQQNTITTIDVSPSISKVYKGNSQFLAATVKTFGVVDNTKEVKWESKNSSIADVNPETGVVTTKGVGTVEIIASLKGDSTITGSATIEVYDGPYIPKSHGGWAGSNIYWDETRGRLWFEDVPKADDSAEQIEKQRYQGVLFKWGSLWGISVVYTGAADYPSATTPYSPDVIVYKSGKTHRSEAVGDALYSSISYLVVDYTVENKDRARSYEETEAVGNGTKYGDICRYLTLMNDTIHGKKWRMPTTNEINEWSNLILIGTRFSTQNTSIPHGTDIIENHVSLNNNSLPLSGERDSDDGGINNVGFYGRYWTSSPIPYNIHLRGSGNPSGLETRGKYRDGGNSVRCVVDVGDE